MHAWYVSWELWSIQCLLSFKWILPFHKAANLTVFTTNSYFLYFIFQTSHYHYNPVLLPFYRERVHFAHC